MRPGDDIPAASPSDGPLVAWVEVVCTRGRTVPAVHLQRAPAGPEAVEACPAVAVPGGP